MVSGFAPRGRSPGPYVLMAVTDARDADTEQLVVRPDETTKVTLTNRSTLDNTVSMIRRASA